MPARDPAEAVRIFDLLLKFFGNGERWLKGRLSDRRGNCCLVGALDFVSGHHAMRADAAEWYLADEIPLPGMAMAISRTVRNSGRDFAAPWLGNGIGPVRLSCEETPFLISTMGVRTSSSCGSSFCRLERRR